MKKKVAIVLLSVVVMLLLSGCGEVKSSTAPVTIGQLGVDFSVSGSGFLNSTCYNGSAYDINNLQVDIKYRDDMGTDTLKWVTGVAPGTSHDALVILNAPVRSSADIAATKYSYQINNASTGEVKEITYDVKSKIYTIKDYSKK